MYFEIRMIVRVLKTVVGALGVCELQRGLIPKRIDLTRSGLTEYYSVNNQCYWLAMRFNHRQPLVTERHLTKTPYNGLDCRATKNRCEIPLKLLGITESQLKNF